MMSRSIIKIELNKKFSLSLASKYGHATDMRFLQNPSSSSTLVRDQVNIQKASSSKGTPDFAQWKIHPSREAITKTYQFKTFYQAFAFMTRCALLAEQMDHHPEWENIYNQVKITLTTHTCNGVSIKDWDMAREMDRYASEMLSCRNCHGNEEKSNRCNIGNSQ